MISPSDPLTTPFAEERRVEVRLPVRRINVLIAGAILSTVDVSYSGIQVHCPLSQFQYIERLLIDEVEIVLELPIGREVTASAEVAYVSQRNEDVFIGFAFHTFRYRDRSGWQAFIESKINDSAKIPQSVA
ncbi:MAG: PilZ domain-containing protein [Pseudomonadota bacterium]